MSRWKWLAIAVVVIVLGLIGYRLMHGGGAAGMRRGGPGGAEGEDKTPVAVTAVAATRQNVPVSFDALGTVQALNTVTVRPQVSGPIEEIEFKEGQEIKAGSVIARIDPRPLQAALDQAKAKKKQDEAQLAGARSTQSRYEELIQKHFVAAQDLENQRHTVNQLQATLAGDDAAITAAQVQLGYTRIQAPIDGVAGIRQVDLGNIVTANSTAIVVLTQVHPINVIFTLPEQNLDQVRSPTPLPVTALDRTDSHVLASGTLTVVDNQIDASTGTFKLKAQFDNVDNALWPGQFVNVRLQVRTLEGAIVVPLPALQRGPEGSYVFLIGADRTVSMQPVTAGIETGDGNVVIAKGLEEGQQVVTEGQFRLKPGSPVLALKPGETPPPALAAPEGKGGQGRRGGGRRGGSD
jgi:multidrug efflux system membrane fusion protein